MGKPFRDWKVSAAYIDGSVINSTLQGPYELEEVKARFGLEGRDVLWYNIYEIKNEKQ